MGADSAETRSRILRVTRDVINERGYEATNFQIIASRAGLSRPTMHYYFHNREAIYASMVEDAIARGEIPSDTDAAAVVNMLLGDVSGNGLLRGIHRRSQ